MRTWAPKGQTPIIQFHFNWTHILVIVGLTGTNCMFRLHEGSIKKEQHVEFPKALRAHLKRPLLILWDGLKAHRSKLVREYLDSTGGEIQMAFLPRASCTAVARDRSAVVRPSGDPRGSESSWRGAGCALRPRFCSPERSGCPGPGGSGRSSYAGAPPEGPAPPALQAGEPLSGHVDFMLSGSRGAALVVSYAAPVSAYITSVSRDVGNDWLAERPASCRALRARKSGAHRAQPYAIAGYR